MSQAAFGSEWVILERNTSLFRDPSNRDRRFIPLLLEDCKIPDTLRRFLYLDYRQEEEKVFAQIVTAIDPDLAYLPETSSPLFPIPSSENNEEEKFSTLVKVTQENDHWEEKKSKFPEIQTQLQKVKNEDSLGMQEKKISNKENVSLVINTKKPELLKKGFTQIRSDKEQGKTNNLGNSARKKIVLIITLMVIFFLA